MKKLVPGTMIVLATIMLVLYSLPAYANHTEVGTPGDCSPPEATLAGSDDISVQTVGPLIQDDPRDNFDRNANGYVCVGQVLEGTNTVAVIHFDDK